MRRLSSIAVMVIAFLGFMKVSNAAEITCDYYLVSGGFAVTIDINNDKLDYKAKLPDNTTGIVALKVSDFKNNNGELYCPSEIYYAVEDQGRQYRFIANREGYEYVTTLKYKSKPYEYNSGNVITSNKDNGGAGSLDSNFCMRTADVWQLIGKVFFIVKIVIPLLIIVLASVDLAKSVVKSDDKELRNNVTRLVKRVIVGIVIFFIPTIVYLVFGMISIFNDDFKKDADNCMKCLTSPYKDCDTSGSKDKVIFK